MRSIDAGLMHGPGHKYLRACCCCVVVGPAAGGVRGRVRSSLSKGGRAREKKRTCMLKPRAHSIKPHLALAPLPHGLALERASPLINTDTQQPSTHAAAEGAAHALAVYFSSEGNRVGGGIEARRGAAANPQQQTKRPLRLPGAPSPPACASPWPTCPWSEHAARGPKDWRARQWCGLLGGGRPCCQRFVSTPAIVPPSLTDPPFHSTLHPSRRARPGKNQART